MNVKVDPNGEKWISDEGWYDNGTRIDDMMRVDRVYK